MKKFLTMFALPILFSLLLTAGYVGAVGQVMNSGGSAVTITQGGNSAIVSAAGALKVDGSAVAQPVTGTFWQATQPVSGPLTDTQLRATAVPVSLAASANVIGVVRMQPMTSCGTTLYERVMATLAAGPTTVTATTTCVEAIYAVNITASAVTIDITDNQGTPVAFLKSFSLPANATVKLPLDGMKFTSGIIATPSGAASVNLAIKGYQ